MSDNNPVRRAAAGLFDRLSEESEDYLEDAYADTWPGSDDEWNHQDGAAPEFEAHREAIFRGVLAELAAMCLERSLGRVPGEVS